MSTSDPLSRLLNLYLLLSNASRPLSLAEITDRIGGFPDSPEARRQAFERAKRDLKALGLPITTVTHPQTSGDAYLVTKKEEARIAPMLNLDEAFALAGAMASVQFGNESGLDSARKLGCVWEGERIELAYVPRVPLVSQFFEAIQRYRVVRARYHNIERRLLPFGVLFRWGTWYLIAREEGQLLVKSFRIENFDPDIEITSEEFDPGDRVDVSTVLPESPTSVRWEDEEIVELEFPQEILSIVIDRLPQLVVNTIDNQTVHASAAISGFGAFVSILIEFGDQVELVAPPRARGRAFDLLSRSLEFQTVVLEEETEYIEEYQSLIAAELSPSAPKAGRESGTSKFKRIMSLLPWLYRNPNTTTQEISLLFGIPESAVGGLLETVACCGLPPFTPDQLIEIIVDGDEITARISEDFASGLRLGATDLFVAALSAKLALAHGDFVGQKELTSAIGKIFDVFGLDSDLSGSLVLDVEGTRNLTEIRRAQGAKKSLRFGYFSLTNQAFSERQVDPLRLFVRDGHWYLLGWCHSSEALKTFRLDRVAEVVILEEAISVYPTDEELNATDFNFGSDQDVDSVLLVIDSNSSWRIARIPHRTIQSSRNPSYLVVEVNVVSKIWLRNFVASSMGDVKVIFPNEVVVGVRDALFKLRGRFG